MIRLGEEGLHRRSKKQTPSLTDVDEVKRGRCPDFEDLADGRFSEEEERAKGISVKNILTWGFTFPIFAYSPIPCLSFFYHSPRPSLRQRGNMCALKNGNATGTNGQSAGLKSTTNKPL